MRGRMLMFLAVLCLLLLSAGWLLQQEKALEQERSILETEIMLLEYENAQLRDMISELRGEQAKLRERMEDWLDTWTMDEFEATAYTLECGNGDGYTATMTIPQTEHTIAVDPDVVPLGSYVYIPGLGWRCAEDTGAAIKKRAIDIYMGTGPAARGAAMRWGRKNIKVVYQK